MWKKLFRVRKLQTAMLMLIIILCTTLLNAAICILTSLNRPYEDLRRECKSATAIIYPYDRSLESVNKMEDDLEKIDLVEHVEQVKCYYISEGIRSNGKLLDCFTRLTLYNDYIFHDVRVIQGDITKVNELREDQCFIPACIANENHLKVGDTIQIMLPKGEKNLEISGIYADTYNSSTAFSSCILVNQLSDDLPLEYHLMLYGKIGATAEKIQNAYRELNHGAFEGEMNTAEDSIENNLTPGMIIGAVFLAMGIIMLIVSGLIINFMVRNTMHQDSKSIAVYKTIGYTSIDIRKMYLVFYLIITLSSSIIGVILSKYVANLLLASIYKNIGEMASVNPINSGIHCITVTVLFVLTIVRLIISRTKKVKPVYALNGMSHTNTKKRHYTGNSTCQFSPFGIAIRNIVRDKKGVLGILITVITTIFSINFGVISLDIAWNQKKNNDYWLGVDKCDVIVTISNVEKRDELESILDSDDDISYYYSERFEQPVILPWKEGQKTNTLYAFVYEDYEKAKIPVVSGRNPKVQNEIAISTKMSDELNKEVGDYMSVNLSGNESEDFLITGIYQSFYSFGKTCRLTKAAYEADDITLNYEDYSIVLKENIHINDYVDKLSKRLDGMATVTKRTEMFPAIINMIVEPQKAALPAILALVCVIGAMNIFSIILLKNKEAEKRNGIYKTLGYTYHHLIKANMIYVGLIAVASCLITLPINLLTYSSIMKLALAMFKFRAYPTTFNPLHLLISNLCILLVFGISTILSSQSLRKVDVRDLVYE